MRILVDINQEQLTALNALAREAGQARAAILRQAVDAYLAERKDPISSYFGLWANNAGTQDVQGYLDGLRDEWER